MPNINDEFNKLKNRVQKFRENQKQGKEEKFDYDYVYPKQMDRFKKSSYQEGIYEDPTYMGVGFYPQFDTVLSPLLIGGHGSRFKDKNPIILDGMDFGIDNARYRTS